MSDCAFCSRPATGHDDRSQTHYCDTHAPKCADCGTSLAGFEHECWIGERTVCADCITPMQLLADMECIA